MILQKMVGPKPQIVPGQLDSMNKIKTTDETSSELLLVGSGAKSLGSLEPFKPREVCPYCNNRVPEESTKRDSAEEELFRGH